MDVNMPIMNGLETTKGILELYQGWAKPPIIIGLTGDSNTDLEDACKAVGMNRIRNLNSLFS